MVVVSANLLMALIIENPFTDAVTRFFFDWLDNGVIICAPALAAYDAADTLTQLIATNAYPADKLEDALETIFILPIQYHSLIDVRRVIEIAMKLEGQSAYEASYLALAERFDCELWTLDEELYKDASTQGFAVRLIS